MPISAPSGSFFLLHSEQVRTTWSVRRFEPSRIAPASSRSPSSGRRRFSSVLRADRENVVSAM